MIRDQLNPGDLEILAKNPTALPWLILYQIDFQFDILYCYYK